MKLLTNIWNIIKSPKFYIPLIICFVLILIGGAFQEQIQNNMKIVLLDVGGIKVDMWSITHILLYVYFGYQFPEYFVEFLLLGSLWEIFESTFCRDSLSKFIGCEDKTSFICDKLGQIRDCNYWYGKLDDVVMNMTGFVLGAWLASKKKTR